MTQRHEDRFAGRTRPQAFGEPIEEQRQRRDVAEIPRGKRLILGPQGFGDLRDRRTGEE
jgi:hypothetical protein